jgi:hypothetical protein
MTAPTDPEPTAGSWLTTGPVVLGGRPHRALGYAIALWFARIATYAELVEEEQYCGPAEEPVSALLDGHGQLPVQAGPARPGESATTRGLARAAHC